MIGNIFLDLFSYLVLVLKSTIFHLLLLFGPVLLLAFVMNMISKHTTRLGSQLVGEKIYIYGFASIGTVVHELGHAVFAILFAHKIEKIVLFSPHNNNSTLGYVHHSYNKKNIYQNIGNFFIGIGPVIFGPLIISILVYLIAGQSIIAISGFDMNLTDIEGIKSILSGMIAGFTQTTGFVLALFSTSFLKALLLFYFIFSIGSSVTLSVPDIRGAKQGLYFFVVVLLLFNLLTLWLGDITGSIISVFITGSYSIIIILIFSITTTLIVNMILWMLIQLKRSLFKS
jgi:hypothetical protein